MGEIERIDYDEFGLFHENAEEYGLEWHGPPTVRRERIEVAPGRELSVLVWGTGDPELVFLHGGMQNAHTWDTVALALGRPLIAIDLPGHGHSDGGVDAAGADGAREAARDVAVVIEALAPNAAAVIGMSFGGLTTVALTEHAPALVRKAVLVDVLPGLTAKHAAHIGEFVNGPPTFPTFADILARTMEHNPTRSESSLRRGILHNAVQLDDGSWVWRHSRWRAEDSMEQTIERLQRRGQGDPDARMFEDLIPVLGDIEVPVLLARGMRPDSVLRDPDEDRLREVLPSATLVRFDEAGHSIQGDMPVELAACIEDFVFG
jgi:pimeloyl-ACP methyl ester carboxylesterase